MGNNYPLLYIRPPGRDICLSCHIFRNKENYIDKKDSEDQGYLDYDEYLILDSSRHVLSDKSQHELSNSKKQLDKLDCYKLRNEPKIVTITIDYSQNLDLPHLLYEKNGDFYYYSPINLYFWYYGYHTGTSSCIHLHIG